MIRLKDSLEKIGHGLLLGIGFSFAYFVFDHFFTQWHIASLERSVFDDTLFKDYGPDAGLTIKSHKPQRAENNAAFIGQIANDGKETWASVEIVAELFDQNGEFLDKCSSYLDGSIEPRQTRNFKVSCPNCPDNPRPAYDSYTLAIRDARFVKAGSHEAVPEI
jgi:hypothetical protein